MLHRCVRVAVLALAAVGLVAPRPALAHEPVAGRQVPVAGRQVMVEYRVVKVAPDSLAALDLGRPEAERLEIGRPGNDGYSLDVAIAGLESAQKARIVSRPMIMVVVGEKAEIESTGPNGDIKLTMRVQPQGDGFAADLVAQISGEGMEPVAIQKDGIELPAGIVRCPEDGDCVVILVHARAQAEAPEK